MVRIPGPKRSLRDPTTGPKANAGRGYRYMIVFQNNPIDGAERLSDALQKIDQL